MAYEQAISDALSAVSLSNASQLKFASWFGSGVSLGPVTEITPGIYYQQSLSGTDALTGSVFPDGLFGLMGSNTTTNLQFIPDISFAGTGSITGTVLTITAVSQGALTVGASIEGISGLVTAGTTISSFGTGTGGTGTYNLNNSQNVAATTITSPAYTTANLSSHIEAILQSTSCPYAPTGSRELYTPVHNRKASVGTNSRPQALLMITRSGTGGLPPPDMQEIYVSMIHFIPSDLATIMDYSYGSNFYNIFDWKTGGWTGGSALGDYRITLIILRGSTGGLYYKLSADNNANGNWNGNATLSVPSVGTVNVTGGNPDGYWAYRTAPGSAESDLGCWIRTHLYVKRPQLINVRSSDIESGARDPMFQQDITTGITYAAVENLTTKTWTTIGSQVGGRQMGCENLPFARIMNAMCYCSATSASDPIVYSKSTGLQIFNKSPIEITLQYSRRSQAPIYWPLRGSIVLSKGSGTPTFTRATAKWVFNDEGKIIKLPSGAIEMRGYRAVINLLASTETLSTQSVTTEARIYTISFYGTGSIAFSGTYAGSDLVGTGVSNRVQRTFTATAGSLTLTVTGSCTKAQLENVTAWTDQTASEYVSVGLLSAPYHGAGIDGVKYYVTTKAGAAIPEASLLGARGNPNQTINTLLYCRDFLSGATAGKWISSITGNNLVINGTFDTDASGWTTFNCSLSVASGQCTLTASGDNPYMSRSMTTVVGKVYVVSCDVVSDSMTGNNFIKVGSSAGSGSIGSLVTVVGTNKFCFVATGTTTYITVSGGAGVSGQTIVVDNITCYEAGVQVALNQTGLGGMANTCSLLTANAANATILQTITAAASAGCSGFYVKRSVGTGSVYITRDGGSNWTDVTSLINSTDFNLVKIENTSVTNPQVGFKIATIGDAIIVDFGLNHLGTQISDPIETTTASVTVNADVLSVQISGNLSDSAGTIVASVNKTDWTGGNGSIVGSSTRGLYTSSSNYGVQGLDGTNTVSGAAGTPTGAMDIGIKWSGTSLTAFSEGVSGTTGSYDGSFNLSSIALFSGAKGAIKDIGIWHTALSSTEISSVTSNI